MSSHTADLSSTAPSSAAGAQGFSRPNPVCTEIGVSVQGSAHTPADGQASQPFLEQTSTVIVFSQGAVVRLSETVVPGQILILRHLRTNEEAACRVVSVKTNPNVKGYVELEFLQAAPNFWQMQFPVPSGAKAPSSPAPQAEPTAAPIRAEQDASPAHAEHNVAEVPKAAVPKPVSPAPAPRHTPPPSEEGNGATGPGLTFLPDLLETLALPGEAKQHAPESAQRPEASHPAPVRAERDASPSHAERDASKQSAPMKPLVAPWIAAPRTDLGKGAPAPGDGRYVSDLLDTLTPIGETILREKPKNAASLSQPHSAPSAPAPSRPAFVASSSADIAMPTLPAESAHAAPRANAPLTALVVAPEVAPLLSGGLISRGDALSRGDGLSRGESLSHGEMSSREETLSRGEILSGDLAPATSKQGWPKPMRILAVAAALALAMAAGAGIYRWEKKPGTDANLAASSQPASPAPASAGSIASPSDAQPAANAAPAETAGASTATAAKDSRASAQPGANAAATAAKTPAVAHSSVVVTAPRGPVVAGMKISAPAAASRSTSQSAPAIAANVPGTVENAAAGGILGDAQPGAPAAPVVVRTSSGAQQPRLLSTASPAYPYAARAEHVQGDVSVDLLINEIGRVASMTVLSGPSLLREAALEALRGRKYAPAMLDGKPTTAHIVVVVHFQL
jgi:protein TonB